MSGGWLWTFFKEVSWALYPCNNISLFDWLIFYMHIYADVLNLNLLFQERAHKYYDGMTKEQFKKMQKFIAARSAKKPSSKL